MERNGASFPEAWGEFLLWRFQLGRFEEGKAYRTASGLEKWPAFLRTTPVRSESCKLSKNTDSDEKLPPLGGGYVRLRPQSKGPDHGGAELTVEGPAGATGFFIMAAKKIVERGFLTFDAGGVARVPVRFGTKEVRNVSLGLGNGHTEEDATLGYSVRLQGRSRTEMCHRPACRRSFTARARLSPAL